MYDFVPLLGIPEKAGVMLPLRSFPTVGTPKKARVM